jgi:hypothetical protein
MTTSTSLVIAATTVAAAIVGSMEYRSRSNVVTAGFWFADDVTFELHDPKRLGGPLTRDERERIKRVAHAEVERAFADFRIRIVDGPDAFYKVAVRQLLTIGNKYASSGQSNVFGPLGGSGAVSFITLAAQAMTYAPQGASRADIVDAIGRGVGRAAVHEFAHQILPKGPMHNSEDSQSYEFWSSDRPAQYYGDIHWSVAHPALVERLARQ